MSQIRTTVPLDSIALVCYLEFPLACFLNELRRELTPRGAPRAHLTILPPRPMKASPEDTWKQIRSRLRGVPAPEIAVNGVAIFATTSVIYLEIGAGRDELEALHARLNTGALASAEPFPYEPHITLAQDVAPAELAGAYERARERWAGYRGPRSFPLGTITLVRNTGPDDWTDLAACELDTSQKARSVPSA